MRWMIMAKGKEQRAKGKGQIVLTALSSLPLALTSRVVLSLGVTFQLCPVKINLSEIARAVTFRLVIEMRRRRVAAFAAGGHGFGAHGLAKLNDGDKAVAARAVNLF